MDIIFFRYSKYADICNCCLTAFLYLNLSNLLLLLIVSKGKLHVSHYVQCVL